ncbi:Epsin-2 [Operophtera brumata]|uniref:Epsin-2 n=1 Tax=Operophtera brumata TaxID=104452 RepID=A0A0L7LIN1_OPEBR|nr:Epsin-2 [Operophtera brumata]
MPDPDRNKDKMPRGKDDMQVNVAGLRRNIKNLAHNYSDAQVKVREATSNDPWGPSSTLMAEIADLTYNVMAFTEIMQMIWKRLNDHGKNWRHVYKDDERLKNERARALKAKQRFAQSASAFGSDGALDTPSSPTYPAWAGAGGREAELARPLTAGEELQLALAMSREEAEREERRRRSDDVRLQLAISQSQNDFQ